MLFFVFRAGVLQIVSASTPSPRQPKILKCKYWNRQVYRIEKPYLNELDVDQVLLHVLPPDEHQLAAGALQPGTPGRLKILREAVWLIFRISKDVERLLML